MTVRVGGYELEHRLGEGAHGRVWRARQVAAFGRPVALKRMTATSVEDLDRLRREAEVLMGMDHPHIVTVLEVIEDGDGVAIAMQLAAGGSLLERLTRRRQLPREEAVAIIEQLAGALTSAHRRGVFHLDLKPGNVLFTSDGDAILADFGAARWRNDDRDNGGSAGYAAPEVVRGEQPDERADVYGLGRLLHAMLGADTDDLAPVIATATAADRDDRHSSIAEFIEHVRDPGSERVCLPMVVEGASKPPLHPPTREFGPRPPRPQPQQERHVSRRFVIAIAGGAAGAALIAGAIASFASRPEPSASASTPVRVCPPAVPPVVPAGGDVLSADIDADGCTDSVVRAGNALERNGVRFVLGESDDVPVVGDWDCDGLATPAVWRPNRHEVHYFTGWAAANESLTAARVVTADGPPRETC